MKKSLQEAITYQDIKVKGYELELIKDLKIKTKLNEHATLNLTGILKSDQKDKDIYLTDSNKEIEVYYYKGNKKTILFYGIVNNVEISIDKQVYMLKLEAKSMSYLMDIKKKSRSFQNVGSSSHQIINNIMSDYNNKNYVVNIPNNPINKLIIQYEETDWEFIKRIASKYNQGIFPGIQNKVIQFTIGIPNSSKEINTENIYYEVFKNLQEYNYMKKNYLTDAREVDFTTYKLNSYEVLNLGDNIPFLGKRFYVCEGNYEIRDGILENIYRLRIKNGLRQKKIFNVNIVGSSIGGKIVGVNGDKVKIHLDIDLVYGGEDYYFEYSTMSASTDGSGWYCMPEKGDRVRVYFPNKNESKAFAVSAVSKYSGQEVGGKMDRMSNPDNKYLRTPHDKEVKLTPEGIFISCNSGQAEMNLTKDGTLTIVGQNNMDINAKENIKMEAQKSVLMSAKEGINLKSDKNGGIDFDKEGKIREIGTKVKNN